MGSRRPLIPSDLSGPGRRRAPHEAARRLRRPPRLADPRAPRVPRTTVPSPVKCPRHAAQVTARGAAPNHKRQLGRRLAGITDEARRLEHLQPAAHTERLDGFLGCGPSLGEEELEVGMGHCRRVVKPPPEQQRRVLSPRFHYAPEVVVVRPIDAEVSSGTVINPDALNVSSRCCSSASSARPGPHRTAPRRQPTARDPQDAVSATGRPARHLTARHRTQQPHDPGRELGTRRRLHERPFSSAGRSGWAPARR